MHIFLLPRLDLIPRIICHILINLGSVVFMNYTWILMMLTPKRGKSPQKRKPPSKRSQARSRSPAPPAPSAAAEVMAGAAAASSAPAANVGDAQTSNQTPPAATSSTQAAVLDTGATLTLLSSAPAAGPTPNPFNLISVDMVGEYDANPPVPAAPVYTMWQLPHVWLDKLFEFISQLLFFGVERSSFVSAV